MKVVKKFDASPNFPCLNGSNFFCIHHNILLTEIIKNKKTFKKMQQQTVYIHI